MKISVVVVTFNAENLIDKTLDSFLKQTLEEKECWVIDGLSRDNTVKVLKEYTSQHHNIHYISEADSGIYNAMNKSIHYITGEYVYFLGAGDVFASEDVLADIAKEALKDIVYGYVNMVESDGTTEKYLKKIDFFHYKFRFRPVCHQAVFAKKTLFERINFNENYKIVADQEWIMHCYASKATVQYVDKAICDYDKTGLSSSEEGAKLAALEMDKIHKQYCPLLSRIYNLLKKIMGKK